MNKPFWKQSESKEWYTPLRYIEAVRATLGSIDLDPATCFTAQKMVRASRIFTVKQNGLELPWKANTVFCNPPYGRNPGTGVWVQKFIQEYISRNFKSGILLILAKTGEKWFQPLWGYPKCFTNHRIRYISGNSAIKNTAGTVGSCFVYFGNNFEEFRYHFEQFGRIVE